MYDIVLLLHMIEQIDIFVTEWSSSTTLVYWHEEKEMCCSSKNRPFFLSPICEEALFLCLCQSKMSSKSLEMTSTKKTCYIHSCNLYPPFFVAEIPALLSSQQGNPGLENSN